MFTTTNILLCRVYVNHTSSLDTILKATMYIVQTIINHQMSQSLVIASPKEKTHSHSQASTEADYPAARDGNINLSPPHEDAIGSPYRLRLI